MRLTIFFSFLAINLCRAELVLKYLTQYNKEGRLMKTDDIQRDSVNVLKTIVIVINGLGSEDNAWVNALIDEYLHKQIHNVFLLELGGSKENNNGTEISTDLIEFIGKIYNETKEHYLDFHLIGTASGFDIAKEVGQKYEAKFNRKINRITGLNPTNLTQASELSFANEDIAALIVVVHSNMRRFSNGLKTYGHVDFYIDDINCIKNEDPSCGHLNAIKMYKRSVNSENLMAVKCQSIDDYVNDKCKNNSRILFGENIPMNANGIYILKYQ